jgi:hypothetical protein
MLTFGAGNLSKLVILVFWFKVAHIKRYIKLPKYEYLSLFSLYKHQTEWLAWSASKKPQLQAHDLL